MERQIHLTKYNVYDIYCNLLELLLLCKITFNDELPQSYSLLSLSDFHMWLPFTSNWEVTSCVHQKTCGFVCSSRCMVARTQTTQTTAQLLSCIRPFSSASTSSVLSSLLPYVGSCCGTWKWRFVPKQGQYSQNSNFSINMALSLWFFHQCYSYSFWVKLLQNYAYTRCCATFFITSEWVCNTVHTIYPESSINEST